MNSFKGKKVALLGFGTEGQDICRFLLKQKAQITVFDEKNQLELENVLKKFQKENLSFELGKKSLRKLLASSWDFVFRSPGFNRFRSEIVKAGEKGALISSATKLFFDLCPGKIIGVTGTKGKGTTSTLIYQILKKDGKQVFLGGNIGRPVLNLLPKITKNSWVVLELSSFQLQDLQKSPHIAVVLFIVSEHLDYHYDSNEYFQSKSNIVRYQNKDDFAVLNADNLISSSFATLTKGQVYCFSRQKKVKGSYVKNNKIYLLDKEIGSTNKLQLLGIHNWENICASVMASYLAGASLSSIKKAVFAFKGLEHRLEFVRNFKGVSFYNDSFSTTPETTIAAINSFKKPIILIAGGSEKGSDYGELGKKISSSTVKTLILIGQMAQRIRDSVLKAGFRGEIIFRPSKKMKEIVGLAFRKANFGEVVLL